MFGKHTLDAAYGQFFSILSQVCWQRGVYFAQVEKNYTSQICPNCGTLTGKKTLDNRVHSCPECGYKTHRDVAAAQVIRKSRPTCGRTAREPNCFGRRVGGR